MLNTRLNTLVVDDDPIFQETIRKKMDSDLSITSAISIHEARTEVKRRDFDLVILDKHLPDGLGTDFIAEVKSIAPHSVIIVLTSDNAEDTVIEALEKGASDYLYKTSNSITELRNRIRVAVGRVEVERRSRKLELLAANKLQFDYVGNSQETQHLREQIRVAAQSEINVLVSGESGTGKELIAASINQNHPKSKSRHFVIMNCGAVQDNLIASELFGHVMGAFTGAVSARAGKIELANGGDLFLDEIGELPLETQALLLRTLNNGEYQRVGSNETKISKFRIISATNRNLEEMVRKGTFRADLYFRIRALEIQTTPLRNRKSEIPELVRHFLYQFGGPNFEISNEALSGLLHYDWPGNVRELKNAVECAVAFSKNARRSQILPMDIKITLGTSRVLKTKTVLLSKTQQEFKISKSDYKGYLDKAHSTYLLAALQANGWDPLKTADSLGISMSTLYRLRVAYQLDSESPRRGK